MARTTHEEEVALAARIAAGDLDARNELVTRNLGLVHHMARHFSLAGEDLDDLVGEGILGMMEAAKRYDPTQGTRFGTWASHWVMRSILMATYRKGLLDKPSRHRNGYGHRKPQAGEVISIDSRIPGMREHVGDHLSDPRATEAFELASTCRYARWLLTNSGLTDRELRVITERFWEDRTLLEVGKRMRLSRERVRQIEALAIEKMR